MGIFPESGPAAADPPPSAAAPVGILASVSISTIAAVSVGIERSAIRAINFSQSRSGIGHSVDRLDQNGVKLPGETFQRRADGAFSGLAGIEEKIVDLLKQLAAGFAPRTPSVSKLPPVPPAPSRIQRDFIKRQRVDLISSCRIGVDEGERRTVIRSAC